MARRLASEGHRITVLCAGSAYAGSAQDAGPSLPGISVRRLCAPSFGHGHAARLTSYAAFYACALAHLLTGPRPDAILTLTTPPLLSLAGTLASRLRHSRHFIWEMDLYPDVAVALAVISSGSVIDRLIGALADFSRRRADGIIALGESMRQRLIARGIPPGRIQVAENWADGRRIRPLPFPPPSPIKILYSGNFGLAHDTATLRDALLLLGPDPRLAFEFAGGGSQRPRAEAFCRCHALANVSFTGYRPAAELPAALGACHIGLVTQKPETLGSVIPSKTYALMAAGRPILYIGPREGTPARLIERFRCGWQIDPGDAPTLAALLQHLAATPHVIQDAGARAHEAFLQHYDLPVGVARICAILGVPQTKPQTKHAAV